MDNPILWDCLTGGTRTSMESKCVGEGWNNSGEATRWGDLEKGHVQDPDPSGSSLSTCFLSLGLPELDTWHRFKETHCRTEEAKGENFVKCIKRSLHLLYSWNEW